MKSTIAIAAAALVAAQFFGTPALALSDDEKAALAAAAILGVAALTHHKHHDRDTTSTKDAQYKAMFERGYRDGLHNEPYDWRHGSTAYSNGYDAGHKERANRLAYKSWDVGGVKVPQAALNSCVSEVAASLNVGSHYVHLIKAGQESNRYYVEMAAGHRHVVCISSSQGEVFGLRDGRI